MARKRKGGKFLQRARKSMEERGTVGSFGKATASKIRKGLHSKSLKKVRQAAFAKAAKTIARRKKRGGARRRGR